MLPFVQSPEAPWSAPKPQYWKMPLPSLKLFLMTHVLNSLCSGDKRASVVRRVVQYITQVYPGKPLGPSCKPVSALLGPSNRNTEGRVSRWGISQGQSKHGKQRPLSAPRWPQLPLVLVKPYSPLNFPDPKYLSPERNQISLTASGPSLLFCRVCNYPPGGGAGKRSLFQSFSRNLKNRPITLDTQDANERQGNCWADPEQVRENESQLSEALPSRETPFPEASAAADTKPSFPFGTMKAATSLSSALTISLRRTPRSYKRMLIPTA